jgi:acetyl-CoA acetyltransferase
MSIIEARDRTAIVGVGHSVIDRNPAADTMKHLAAAMKAALDDAGLSKDDLDGLVVGNVHGVAEASMDKVPEMFGLENIQYAFQSWTHGRITPTVIAVAAEAVLTGQADVVACIGLRTLVSHRNRYANGAAGRNVESLREGAGPHLESPPYGNVGIHGGAALPMQKYFLKYGGSERDLGEVAIAQREWACLNPVAYFHGQPITIDDYLNSRYIVTPLRLFDCSLPANWGCCVIVTSAERARDCRKRPVYLSGMQGSASGQDYYVFARTGLGVGQQREFAYKAPEMTVYKMAGVTPQDIDVVGTMDEFSPLVLFCLEEFGFCGEGEALQWIQGGRIRKGGELPTNTSGGMLSEMNSAGWGHIIELVRQLRGECGDRQVEGAKLGQYLALDRCSLLLRN